MTTESAIAYCWCVQIGVQVTSDDWRRRVTNLRLRPNETGRSMRPVF